MNPFLTFIIRAAVAIPVGGVVWLISFFALDFSFFASVGTSILGAAISFWVVKEVLKSRFINEQQLTRREYKYIENNLKEAKEKLRRLNRALFSLKQISSFRQNTEIFRLARRIYTITKNEPRRFYLAEKFFFYHLDSFVELAEKYAFLSAQPTKNRELDASLKDARVLLEQMKISLEKDLEHILSQDIHQLNFELDVAKRNLQNMKELEIHEDNRRLK